MYGEEEMDVLMIQCNLVALFCETKRISAPQCGSSAVVVPCYSPIDHCALPDYPVPTS